MSWHAARAKTRKKQRKQKQNKKGAPLNHKWGGFSSQELMEAMFPTQLGEYERARSTWKENNKGWLKWVEIGGKIVAVGAIIAGSILSGGTLAPVLIGAGTAYLVADSSYQAISGETISGTRLSNEDRAWAAADAVLTAATGGLATYASVLAKTGKVASTTVQTATKVANYADDANDIAQTIRTAQDDPLGAALQFGVGRAIGHGATALGNKARARIGNGGGTSDVDLPTGGKKGVEVPTGSSPRLKATEAPDIDASGLGKGKNVKPEVSASNRSGVDASSTNNRSADVDVTKNPKFDSSNRPTIDKTNTKAGDIDTGKPVKPEVSASNRSGVDVPSNNRPADVDVTKKPEVSSSRPTEVTNPKTEAEVPSKVNPDLDDAAAAARAIPRVKAQEPDLPKAGQPETSPSEPSKKVQKPEEVDTETNKVGESDILVNRKSLDIDNLTPQDIPTVKSGKFESFFNSLTVDELDEIWKNKSLRKKIERQLREPGGLHEWHLVSRAPQFKYWGISAEKIRELRSEIPNVKFVNPDGVHGGLGSTKAHNELLEIIDSSIDYDMFVRRLNNWANYRLNGGISSLPEGLRFN